MPAIVSFETQRIDDALRTHRLDRATAATLKQRLPAAVRRLLEEVNTSAALQQVALSAAAAKLGLSVEELDAMLQSGMTIADLAGRAHVDLSTLVDDVVSALRNGIHQLVAARQLSARQSARLLGTLRHDTAYFVGRRFTGS